VTFGSCPSVIGTITKGHALKHRSILVAASLLAMLVSTVLLTGCNTWKGAGKDVERGGEMMQGKD
jgi:predicted small secreted protein